MRALVNAMAQKSTARTFSKVIDLAREQGLSEGIVGTAGDELGRWGKAALGSLLTRYDRRLILRLARSKLRQTRENP
jgi:hypothetical protein